MPTAAGVSAVLLTAGTALAAQPASGHLASSATPRVSCSSNPKQNGKVVASNSYTRSNGVKSTFTSTIELMYSSTCRSVWAVEVGGFEAGSSADYFWVFNENTGVTKKATFPATGTGAIDDTNTESHACMENDGNTDNEAMPKTCTDYF